MKLVGPPMGFECYNFFTPPDDPKSSKVSPTKKNQSKKAKLKDFGFVEEEEKQP